jgi:hypothetical protein
VEKHSSLVVVIEPLSCSDISTIYRSHLTRAISQTLTGNGYTQSLQHISRPIHSLIYPICRLGHHCRKPGLHQRSVEPFAYWITQSRRQRQSACGSRRADGGQYRPRTALTGQPKRWLALIHAPGRSLASDHQ